MLLVCTQQIDTFICAIQCGNLTGVVCFLTNPDLTGLFVTWAYRYLPATQLDQPYRRSPTGQLCSHFSILTPGIGQNLGRTCVICPSCHNQGILATPVQHGLLGTSPSLQTFSRIMCAGSAGKKYGQPRVYSCGCLSER